MLKVDFRMLTISIPVYCKKKKKKKKNTRSLYLTCMNKPTHLYTIFTEMMTHYYHFHQQNSPSSYHHRNKGSLGLYSLPETISKTTPLVYQNWWKCTSKPLSIPVHHVLGSTPPPRRKRRRRRRGRRRSGKRKIRRRRRKRRFLRKKNP